MHYSTFLLIIFYILGTEDDELAEPKYSADEENLIEIYRKLDNRGKKCVLRNAKGELDMLGRVEKVVICYKYSIFILG